MKIAVYSAHSFEKEYIKAANTSNYKLIWVDETLSTETINKAEGCDAITIFSSDKANKEVLTSLKDLGVKMVASRSAGTDHIDLNTAEKLGIKVTNVPAYSPNAIAEHCIALTLALYRKLKPSFERIANYNFSLEGQVGTEIHSKTVGICGTGDIGSALAHLFNGFNAKVLLFDTEKNNDLAKKSWATYVDKKTLLKQSDIISLNLPLNDGTSGFISTSELEAMKDAAILINTGRGGLVDTSEVYKAVKDKRIAGFAMDVYENEKGIFYEDLSSHREKDNLLTSLIALNNVVVTAHQAFLTETALHNMMKAVFEGLTAFSRGSDIKNLVSANS